MNYSSQIKSLINTNIHLKVERRKKLTLVLRYIEKVLNIKLLFLLYKQY